ncbi:unnamed protein product [Thlaspi arvense]|uniref:Uncharacterized protein n=1 Tax=Thlaspi arvense TaxID=13288 RepID=A0AAU9RVF7_THLAR|nr:unnamed protein product [Thlaspi arvense]
MYNNHHKVIITNKENMKMVAIFLASCVLFSLLPSHLSQGLIIQFCSSHSGEPSLIATERRQWCPFKKQIFSGSCSKDGGQQCLDDLLRTWDPSVRLSPVYCNCTPKPNNKRLCSCPNMICP